MCTAGAAACAGDERGTHAALLYALAVVCSFGGAVCCRMRGRSRIGLYCQSVASFICVRVLKCCTAAC